jgi:hypothetical protein
MKYLRGYTSPRSRIASMLRNGPRLSHLTPPTLAACFVVAGVVLAAFLAQSALALLQDAPRAARAEVDSDSQTRVSRLADPAASRDLRPVRLKKLDSAALGLPPADPIR